MLLQLTVRK